MFGSFNGPDKPLNFKINLINYTVHARGKRALLHKAGPNLAVARAVKV